MIALTSAIIFVDKQNAFLIFVDLEKMHLPAYTIDYRQSDLFACTFKNADDFFLFLHRSDRFYLKCTHLMILFSCNNIDMKHGGFANIIRMLAYTCISYLYSHLLPVSSHSPPYTFYSTFPSFVFI